MSSGIGKAVREILHHVGWPHRFWRHKRGGSLHLLVIASQPSEVVTGLPGLPCTTGVTNSHEERRRRKLLEHRVPVLSSAAQGFVGFSLVVGGITRDATVLSRVGGLEKLSKL